ncbi:MAG: hypothetical protein ACLFQ6_10505 [Candidatus Sumerlaeia bacterium]
MEKLSLAQARRLAIHSQLLDGRAKIPRGKKAPKESPPNSAGPCAENLSKSAPSRAWKNHTPCEAGARHKWGLVFSIRGFPEIPNRSEKRIGLFLRAEGAKHTSPGIALG